MYISDVIDEKEMNSWNKGDVITIKAPTGRGKSHFIKYDLYEKAKREDKKILMLIHRRNCVDQFQMELEQLSKHDTGVIDIRTYQSIEAIEKAGHRFDFSKYDYICIDEFHYFVNESSFNYYTDLSLNEILRQHKAIKIFMSATGDKMQKFLNDKKHIETIDYDEFEADFSHVKELTFFKDELFYEEFIERCIKKNLKAIIFINNVKKAFHLHHKFKENTLFNCSQSNEYYEFVDADKIQAVLKNERFEENVLITTSVMDAGLNLKDEELTNVVIDINEIDVFIQCLGRKRLMSNNDYIRLYVKDYDNKQFNGMKSQVQLKLDKAEYYMNHGEEEFVLKYGRSAGSIAETMVYDEFNVDRTEKKINQLMYFRADNRINELNEFMKVGYKKYISNLLGIKEEDAIFIDFKKQQDELEHYLERIVGEKLFKDQQKELKEVFMKNGLKARTMGINTLNGNLKDRNMNYIIEVGKRQSYRDVDGKVKKEKSHWIVDRIM